MGGWGWGGRGWGRGEGRRRGKIASKCDYGVPSEKEREKAESHWETFGGREWNIIAWALCCLSLLKE